jgi:BolA protein
VTGAERGRRLRELLTAHFQPQELVIEDDSHHHAGHAGAAGGMSHFRVRIVADAFRGMPPVARHRLVFGAVGDLMRTDIHALAIDARAPEKG